jgi:hypothetical protein
MRGFHPRRFLKGFVVEMGSWLLLRESVQQLFSEFVLLESIELEPWFSSFLFCSSFIIMAPVHFLVLFWVFFPI